MYRAPGDCHLSKSLLKLFDYGVTTHHVWVNVQDLGRVVDVPSNYALLSVYDFVGKTGVVGFKNKTQRLQLAEE